MGWSTSDGRRVLLEDWVANGVRWFVPASVVLLIALGAWKRRWFPPPGAGALALFVGCGGVFWMGARKLSDGVMGPDGATYVFFHHQIMQGRSAYLGRVVSLGPFWRTVQPIESHEGEFRSVGAHVFRPTGVPEYATWVAITEDGFVLGIEGDFACRQARVGSDESVPRGTIEQLSPFAALGVSGVGDEREVERDIRSIREGRQTSAWPTDAHLSAALDSVNPWVRGAARRIVEAGGADIYPEATKRLASAPK
jgi:hypothetical protein